MKIFLTKPQASLLGWTEAQGDLSTKNASDNDKIRACFFLGYGLVFIHELILNPSRVQEAEAILHAACLLGMDTTNCEILVI